MKYTLKEAGPDDEIFGGGFQLSPGPGPELKRGLLDRSIRVVNRAPALCTALLGMILYPLAFLAVLFAAVPFDGAFVPRFLALCGVGTVLLLYHWFISRYVRSSVLAQAINLALALIPVAGVALIMSGLPTLTGN
jgi:hypothetical protein